MEIYQVYGDDIQLNVHAEIELVSGIQETNQRLLRRLLTNPGSYVFAPTYGAGLGLYVGQNLSQAVKNQLIGVITTQLLDEATVSKSNSPTVSIQQDNERIYIKINYIYAPSSTPTTLSFTVEP